MSGTEAHASCIGPFLQLYTELQKRVESLGGQLGDGWRAEIVPRPPTRATNAPAFDRCFYEPGNPRPHRSKVGMCERCYSVGCCHVAPGGQVACSMRSCMLEPAACGCCILVLSMPSTRKQGPPQYAIRCILIVFPSASNLTACGSAERSCTGAGIAKEGQCRQCTADHEVQGSCFPAGAHAAAVHGGNRILWRG